jgi:hypothetical protein
MLFINASNTFPTDGDGTRQYLTVSNQEYKAHITVSRVEGEMDRTVCQSLGPHNSTTL